MNENKIFRFGEQRFQNDVISVLRVMKGQKVNDHSVLFDEQGQRLFANFAGKLFERDKMLIV